MDLSQTTFQENRKLSCVSRLADFVAGCQRFSEIATQAGFRVLPFRDPSVPHFSKLSESAQHAALDYVSRHLSIFDQLIADSGIGAIKDSVNFIWRALRSLGFTPPSNIFDKIEEEDIVTIYCSNFYQLFRNLSLFNYVSLSLEELSSVHVPDLLTITPEEAVTQFMELAEKIRSREIDSPFQPKIHTHVWREKFGANLSCKADIKWMAPIRRSDGNYVVIVVTKALGL